MKYKLNEVVFELCAIIKKIMTTHGVEQKFYPRNLIFDIHGHRSDFDTALRQTLFPDDYKIDAQDHAIEWQIFQVYRIVNAMHFNKRFSNLKSELKAFKEKLECIDPIKTLIAKIENKEKERHLVCSGHGKWDSAFGFVKLTTQRFVIYTPPKTELSNKVAFYVEANEFSSADPVLVQKLIDKYKRKKYLKYFELEKKQYPKMFDPTHSEIPNYRLTSGGRLRACLLERDTGRIFEVKTSILLTEILDNNPDCTLHWAACESYYHNNSKVPFFQHRPNIRVCMLDRKHAERIIGKVSHSP